VSEPACVNLAQLFGDRYKVAYDPAYDPFNVPHDKRDPWMMQLPCERGTIYPHGGDLLAVEVDNRTPTARKVAALPGVCVSQGDDGKPADDPYKDWGGDMTFLFPLALFDRVAALVKPRKRRRLSEEDKARLLASQTAEGRAAALQRARAARGWP
jgi:hypothetical protein